ncbi:hypothetical protein IAU60_006355 [Kwoniella sp. DSM 27419]
MAPANRKQRAGPSTTAQSRQTDALADFQARRVNRRLDDLERTNPTDIPASSFVPPTHHDSPLPLADGVGSSSKKKMSANVRRVLYAKKGLKDWLDELPPDPLPPYLSATAPPPVTPPRPLCSSCGYIGAYKCPRCAEWSCDRTCLETHARDGGCGLGG